MADEICTKARLYKNMLVEHPEKLEEIEIKVKNLEKDLNNCKVLLKEISGITEL